MVIGGKDCSRKSIVFFGGDMGMGAELIIRNMRRKALQERAGWGGCRGVCECVCEREREVCVGAWGGVGWGTVQIK